MAKLDKKTDRDLLEETYKLARDNRKMLKAIRRDAFIGFLFKIIIVAAFIGLPVYLYFTFLQPYLNEVRSIYTDIQGDVDKVREIGDRIPEFPDLGGIIDNFSGSQ